MSAAGDRGSLPGSGEAGLPPGDDATFLDDLVARVCTGETPEQVLLEYPAEATALLPVLRLAAALHTHAPATGAEASLARARVRTSIMAAASAQLSRPRFIGAAMPLSRSAGLVAAAASAVVALSSGGAVVASATALPGELLYPVKLAVEEARVAVAAADPEAQSHVHAALAQRRVDEVARLAERSRPVPPAVVEAAVRRAEQAEIAAARAPESRRAEVTVALERAEAQRAEALARVAAREDLPAPAHTAVARALENRAERRQERGRPDRRTGGGDGATPAASVQLPAGTTPPISTAQSPQPSPRPRESPPRERGRPARAPDRAADSPSAAPPPPGEHTIPNLTPMESLAPERPDGVLPPGQREPSGRTPAERPRELRTPSAWATEPAASDRWLDGARPGRDARATREARDDAAAARRLPPDQGRGEGRGRAREALLP